MFIAALLTMFKTGFQYSSMMNRIKKTWYIHIMEYHSAMKRSKIMSFAKAWMQLIVLCEISQQKDKYHMISLYMCNLK